jgi:hypothetical protein
MSKDNQNEIMFYKVTFDQKMKPTITPLDSNKIWNKDEGGMDSSKPFVVINPGNGGTNKENLATLLEEASKESLAELTNSKIEKKDNIAEFEKALVGGEAKFFEKGLRSQFVTGERQYIVTVNEAGYPNRAGSKSNMDLIKAHNINPEGFTTDYTKKQARLIYGPLVTEKGVAPDGSGVPLPDAQIIENLSKARSYNASFGTITANCQENALVGMMRSLKIARETIKTGVESMRRVDGPNMAGISKNGIFASAAIFEGSNDKLAEEFSIGGKVPPLPDGHSNMDVASIGENRVKVYQKQPIEVYHPAKKPTQEEKVTENTVRHNLPESFDTQLPKHQRTNTQNTIKDKILGYIGLDGLRFKDAYVHNAPHITCEATPGNEVKGRDPDRLYKLMADMMTRKDAKDVYSCFKQTPAASLSQEIKQQAKDLGTKIKEQKLSHETSPTDSKSKDFIKEIIASRGKVQTPVFDIVK